MKIFGYIYKTTCWLTGAIYVGQKRWLFNEKYFGSGKHLNLAINKYGLENFSVELIQYAHSQKELDSLEKCCIVTLRSVIHEEQIYNIAEGGLKGIILRGKNNPRYGKPGMRGADNPNWKGGRCTNGYYFSTCQDCGKTIRKESKRCKSCVGKLRPKNKFKRMVKLRGSPWNAGLTKETDPRVAESAKKKEGHIAWNNGLTKETHPSIAKYAKAISKKMKGRHSSPATEFKKNDPRLIGNTYASK